MYTAFALASWVLQRILGIIIEEIGGRLQRKTIEETHVLQHAKFGVVLLVKTHPAQN